MSITSDKRNGSQYTDYFSRNSSATRARASQTEAPYGHAGAAAPDPARAQTARAEAVATLAVRADPADI